MDQKNSLDINKMLKEYRTEEVFRKKLNEGLAQTGILLENEVESIFFKNKFTVTTGHYHDKDEEGTDTTRQIDILAFKKYGEIKNRYLFSCQIDRVLV